MRIRKMTAATLAAAALALPVAQAAPAAAQTYDCRILGPAYVSEVLDCARYLLITLIDWP
jgi:type IV secretory pathway VirB2 component (pilin)